MKCVHRTGFCIGFLGFLVLVSVLTCACLGQNQAASPVSPPGEPENMGSMRVAFPPTSIPVNGSSLLAYELELSDYEKTGPAPVQLDILDGTTGTILVTLKDDALASAFLPASWPAPSPDELESGTSKLERPRIAVRVRLPGDRVPTTLLHRLTFEGGSGTGTRTETGAPTPVLSTPPVRLSAPVGGNGWIMYSSAPGTGTAVPPQVTQGGITRVPQRYVANWVQADLWNRTLYSGNGSVNTQWYGYGEEILAVGNGPVIEITDGIPDNAPNSQVPSLATATRSGNRVVQDIGNGRYAAYQHLSPGTISVSVGNVLHTGDSIGRIGNSGNSTIPHLELRITDSPGDNAGEGLPYVFDSFTTTGTWTFDAATGQYGISIAQPRTFTGELPESGVILNIPALSSRHSGKA